MGNFFSPAEIVRLGIQIEKNGRDFYNAVKQSSESEKAREMFAFLAGQEEKHIKVFESILSETEDYQPPETYSGEFGSYLEVLAGEHVFTRKDSGSEAAKKVKNQAEAIDMAIGFEKDSILLFLEMKKMVPENGHKSIDRLIEQEQEHLKTLAGLKKTL